MVSFNVSTAGGPSFQGWGGDVTGRKGTAQGTRSMGLGERGADRGGRTGAPSSASGADTRITALHT